MSVFTTVTPAQLSHWLGNYPLGELLELKGIASGITNTNYFVTTTTGRYVLTLFEKNTPDELPYFLDLMAHLADRDVLCPHPVASKQGQNLGEINHKPAALVTCLKGHSLETPSAIHCAEIGRAMASMHLAGDSYKVHSNNQRGDAWRTTTAAQVMGFLNADDKQLLEQTLAMQASFDKSALPHGVIHADMFRDNVLFDGDKLGGIIDFYYACHDVLLYDIAIAVNDWCVNADGSLDAARAEALIAAYHSLRPLTQAEQEAWPSMLCIAALRFWLSRLYDFHYPQAGELTHAKDPEHFRKILQIRVSASSQLSIPVFQS